MSENFDLFGMPILEGRAPRGRPKHDPTVETRNKVNMLLAFGWADERIASVIGISKPTLYKYYFNEMKRRLIARDLLDVKRIQRLWELADQGSVTAFKEFGRLIEKNDASNAERSFRGDDDDDDDDVVETKPEKLGKKETAALAAEAVEQTESWGNDLAFRGRQLN